MYVVTKTCVSPFCGMVEVVHFIVEVCQVPDDRRGVLQDGVELQEGVDSILSVS